MMDAVELPLPAAFTITEFMGSEGFVGAGGKDPMSGYSDSVSVVVTPFIADRVSFNTESVRKGILKVELDINNNGLLHSPEEHVFIEVSNESSVPSSLVSEDKQIKKYGKKFKSNSYGMKRLRKAQPEDAATKDGEERLSKPRPQCHMDKNQVFKQKSSNMRRLDKKNVKVSIKSKCESSARTGLIGPNSAAPVNNIFGPYGIKADNSTFVDIEEEYALDAILKENVTCLVSSQEKGKKFRNTTKEIIQSINMACAILDMGKQASTFLCDDASVKNSTEGSEIAALYTDSSSSQKTSDLCEKTNTFTGITDFPLLQPKDILEHLEFSGNQNLESLLFDMNVPAAAISKNMNDSGKSMSSMQCFPWSHSSRTNLDATKLSVRNTCQGKWIKLGNEILTIGDNSDFITDFESLIYSNSLVSSEDPKSKRMVNTYSKYESPRFPRPKEAHLSCEMNSVDSSILQVNSPRAVAAAETLLELASHYSLTKIPQKAVKWPRKLRENVTKICKPKFVERNMELSSRSAAKANTKGDFESKELQFCTERKQEYGLATAISKGSLNWSTLRCSRSAPHRPLMPETKHLNAKVQPSSIAWRSRQNSTKN